MVPTYNKIPSRTTFDNDTKVWYDFLYTDDPALKRIKELLQEYERATHAQKLPLLCYLVNATRYWIKNTSAKRDDKVQSGAVDSMRVGALADVCRRKLMARLNINDPTQVQNVVVSVLGTDMHSMPQTLQTDLKFVRSGWMAWLDESVLRTKKLCFRQGKAYRCADAAQFGTAKTLELFDTTNVHDLETPREMKDFTLYVMGQHGRIYAGGVVARMFNHSSFLQGTRIAGAGEICCIQGQIVTISASSGHYHPTMQQMVNVLERLAVYGVELAKVRVLRKFKVNDDKREEYCQANDLLAYRRWPTNNHPNDIYYEI